MNPRTRITAARAALWLLTEVSRPVRSLAGLSSGLEARLCRLAALRPDARVRLTGRCCNVGKTSPGSLATVLSYDEDAGDYRVRVDGADYRWSDGTPWVDGYDHACARGFDVVDWR